MKLMSNQPSLSKKINPQIIFLLLIFGTVIYLVVPPLILLLISSLQNGLPFETLSFTFEIISSTYSDPATYETLFNTLIFAIGSLSIGLSLSITLAWIVERTNIPFRNVMYVLILIPMVIPGMLSAIAWIFLLGPTAGLINLMIRYVFRLDGNGPLNIFSLGGMCFVTGIRMVPTVFLLMVASFRNMDPVLEEAGSVSGASQISILRNITFPLMRPAILAALVYYMVVCFAAFEVPGVLGVAAGIHVFSTRIFWATHPFGGLPHYGEASSLALFLIVLCILLLILYRQATKNAERFTTITGKGYRPRIINIGKWRYICFCLFIIFFIFAVALPVLVFIWGSLHPFFAIPSLKTVKTISLNAYRFTWAYPGVKIAFKNTIILGVVSATACMFLVSITSWIVVRSKLPGRKMLDVLTFIPNGIPGIALGLALMYLYLYLPVPIYGTLWVIIIANIILWMPFAARAMTAALFQMHKELEEAAQTSGASWKNTYIKITLPLILPAFLNGWLWVAIHAVRELSAALMLFSPDTVVLSTIIWNFWDNGRIGETCVVGVVLIVILSLLTIMGRLLTSWRSRMF